MPISQQQNLGATLKEVVWDKVFSNKNIENYSDEFVIAVNETMTPFIKKINKKRRKGNNLPWITGECWKLMKERDQLLKKSLKSGLTTDRQKYNSIINKVMQTIKRAKVDFFMNTIEEAKGNGKMIWQNINKLIGRDKN